MKSVGEVEGVFFVLGAIFVTGLSLLKKYTRVGFYIAQIAVVFVWAFAQYNDLGVITDFFPLWILASLAALAVKPKRPKDPMV